jgi:divinyl protochlorophyllide a 8-vinyl-reductase
MATSATARLHATSHGAPTQDACGVAARIGPNAIIQTAAALVDRVGAAEATALLQATTQWSLDHLPETMVDEREVTALVAAVMARHPGPAGEAIMCESGVRTADYLLRVRIPRLAQRVLALLPPRFGLRLLLSAITRNSWTFAGSATFSVERDPSHTTRFSLVGCPVCRGMSASAPACHYYASTVERLVRAILAPSAQVVEEECEAMGASRCRFRIALTPDAAPR